MLEISKWLLAEKRFSTPGLDKHTETRDIFGSKIKMPLFLTCDGLTEFLEDFNGSELHSKLSLGQF